MILVNNEVSFNSDMLITQNFFLEKFQIQYLMMGGNGVETCSRNWNLVVNICVFFVDDFEDLSQFCAIWRTDM
jgi:hypothetical protein